jgi:hypothetical protein
MALTEFGLIETRESIRWGADWPEIAEHFYGNEDLV